MNENQETELKDFMSAFDDDFDNQDETAEREPETEEQTGDQAADQGSETEEETDQDGEQKGDTAADEKAKADSETFTLKVNKEERTYNREEVISLAQKGADYDRVKDQLTASRQLESDLRAQLAQQQEQLDILAEIAKASKLKVSDLLDNLQIGMLQKSENISADVAKERLLRMKAEKEAKALKTAQAAGKGPTGKEKAQQDVAAFRKDYPNVELTQELMDALLPGVEQGKSLSDSYRDYSDKQKDDQIAQLKAELEAEKQNKENRASSPGSQKDTGGKHTKDEYEDFMKAFS